MTTISFCFAQLDHDVSHYSGTTDPSLGGMLESDRVVREWLDNRPCNPGDLTTSGSGGNDDGDWELLRNPFCSRDETS